MPDDGTEGMQAPKGFLEEDRLTNVMDLLEVPDSEQRKVAMYLSMPQDELAFELDKSKHYEEGATFSQEGVANLVEGIRQWAMSRVWKRWKDTEKPPQKMVVTCKITWE